METIESIVAGTRILLAAAAEVSPKEVYYNIYIDEGDVGVRVGVGSTDTWRVVVEGKTILAAALSAREQVVEMARKKIQKAGQVADLLKEIQ